MRTARIPTLSSALVALATIVVFPVAAYAQPGHGGDKPASGEIRIPASIAAEHKEIVATLAQATRESGPVGVAARELAGVLEPHFEREEQIALPPLGLLAPLAAGARIPDDAASAALSMSQSLRSEMPRMMEEHQTIRSAVRKLGEAARSEKAARYERFAEALASHARSEEEVLYPAAILVGDLVRAKRAPAGSGPARN